MATESTAGPDKAAAQRAAWEAAVLERLYMNDPTELRRCCFFALGLGLPVLGSDRVHLLPCPISVN